MSSLLTLAEFRSRTPMAPADIDALVCLRWTRQSTDATAATATGETRVGEVGETGSIATALVVPNAALVASDTNYATINLYKRTNGGGRVLLASLITRTTGVGGSGDWAKDVPLALTISVSAITAGDVLTGEITKTGTGVVVPSFALIVRPTVTVVDRMLGARTSWILSRLRKRYDTVAITAAPPEVARGWLESLVTMDCYLRRGFAPTSEENNLFMANAETAKAELKEAADSKDGLFDLPLLPDPAGGSAVSKGGPLGYTEQSPFAWTTAQRNAGRADDQRGGGS
jgi:hypothetical protein